MLYRRVWRNRWQEIESRDLDSARLVAAPLADASAHHHRAALHRELRRFLTAVADAALQSNAAIGPQPSLHEEEAVQFVYCHGTNLVNPPR